MPIGSYARSLIKKLLIFNEILKLLKGIRLLLPIYIIRRVNNTLPRNGGENMAYFAKNNIEKEVIVNEKQRSNSKNFRGK